MFVGERKETGWKWEGWRSFVGNKTSLGFILRSVVNKQHAADRPEGSEEQSTKKWEKEMEGAVVDGI